MTDAIVPVNPIWYRVHQTFDVMLTPEGVYLSTAGSDEWQGPLRWGSLYCTAVQEQSARLPEEAPAADLLANWRVYQMKHGIDQPVRPLGVHEHSPRI